MKTVIIYKSIHHGNTKKIAEEMASSLEADLLDLKDANKDIIKNYDLFGFGSGIYYGKPYKKLMKFVEELDPVENKKAFAFSTSGRGNPNNWLTENYPRKVLKSLESFIAKDTTPTGLPNWLVE